jgi:signal transduction histidine kinase
MRGVCSISLITSHDEAQDAGEQDRESSIKPAIGQGNGAVIALVYGIVKQHKGFIDERSEPGKGTAFRIPFPLTSAPDQPWRRT